MSRSLTTRWESHSHWPALARVSGRMGDFDAAPRYLEDAARTLRRESGMKSLLALIPCVKSEVGTSPAGGINSPQSRRARR